MSLGRAVAGGLLALGLLPLDSLAADFGRASSSVLMQPVADTIAVAKKRIDEAIASDSAPSPGQVVVVYFTPRDKAPAKNHTERIRRIVEETVGFYDKELARHGFGDRKMQVLRNQDGEVDVIDVVGVDNDYDKPDGSRIRREVVPVLRQRGIAEDTSVILLFCNLMDYDPLQSTISHHSPYYGGGTHLNGTAWQCDSEILDPQRLTDATPLRDAEYGRITIGKHNSIFIGGVIHELGHALSLPHCRQRSDEARLGTALMGSGNRTYAEQLRGEGLGTFLTLAHAFRLAAHPVFNRSVAANIRSQIAPKYTELRVIASDDGRVLVVGQLESEIPVHAVVAYFDPEGGGDYDAITSSAVPDDAGNFAMQSDKLVANKNYALRIIACHVNGSTSTRTFTFKVDPQGHADVSVARLELELNSMIDALRDDDLSRANRELERYTQDDAKLRLIGKRVIDRFQSSAKPLELRSNEIPQTLRTLPLSRLVPNEATVGWLRPTYNAVPAREKLLSIGGDYFAEGIYAHAPASHSYTLDGSWKQLRGRVGIQATNLGRVNFEILGNGKRLWSSGSVSAGDGKAFELDIQGVTELMLVVNDSGDGNAGDWGVWIEPTLIR